MTAGLGKTKTSGLEVSGRAVRCDDAPSDVINREGVSFGSVRTRHRRAEPTGHLKAVCHSWRWLFGEAADWGVAPGAACAYAGNVNRRTNQLAASVIAAMLLLFPRLCKIRKKIVDACFIMCHYPYQNEPR